MPSTYTLYQEINSLEEFAFIAGSDFTLTFTAYNESGVLQDIGGATIKWTLSPYGQNENILQINGALIDNYSFQVVIPASSTVGLSGKYVHQAVIHSFFGQTFIPAQGIILVIPKTAEV